MSTVKDNTSSLSSTALFITGSSCSTPTHSNNNQTTTTCSSNNNNNDNYNITNKYHSTCHHRDNN